MAAKRTSPPRIIRKRFLDQLDADAAAERLCIMKPTERVRVRQPQSFTDLELSHKAAKLQGYGEKSHGPCDLLISGGCC